VVFSHVGCFIQTHLDFPGLHAFQSRRIVLKYYPEGHLFEIDIWFGWICFFREVGKRKRVHVLVQRDVSHDPVSIDRNLIGKRYYRIAVSLCDKKVYILKQNGYLDNRFEDLQDDDKKYSVKETDGDLLAG
jgi:hypothetical protein